MFTTNAPAPVDKAVVLTSGGMDSAVALALTAKLVKNYPIAYAVRYNQRHGKQEQVASKKLSDHFDAHWFPAHLPIDTYSTTLSDISEEPLTPNNLPLLPKTYIPGRNIIMLAHAGALAAGQRAELVVGGWHQEDYPGYPDCRQQFLLSMEGALQQGLAYNLSIWAPLLYMNKRDIVELGQKLQVPWEKTWSCYAGGEKPCRKCDSCVRREAAFAAAGVKDPLQ